MKNTLQLVNCIMLPPGAAAAQSSFNEVAFPFKKVEAKLMDTGLQRAMKLVLHDWVDRDQFTII